MGTKLIELKTNEAVLDRVKEERTMINAIMRKNIVN